MTRIECANLQRDLVSKGYGPLVIDGVYGRATKEAYDKFLEDNQSPISAPPAAKPWWQSSAITWALTAAVGYLFTLVDISVSTEQSSALVVGVLGLLSTVMSILGSRRREAPIDATQYLPGRRFQPRGVGPMPGSDSPYQDSSPTYESGGGFWSNLGNDDFMGGQ